MTKCYFYAILILQTLIPHYYQILVVNDNHGHNAGDVILSPISAVINQEQTRDMKHNLIVGRVGDNEFTLYYEGISLTGDSELAPAKTYDRLYKEADKALYIAKGAGKKTFAFR
jgi:GGDEF domain-containing protein